MANKGDQEGPQPHAEGQHGEKAHAELIDTLHGKHGGSEESEGAPQEGSPYGEVLSDGRRRLREDRQQHDEAEKNSEARRAAEGKGTNRPSNEKGR
jgi:hypothetical protein